jgi:hypothetical protein
MLVKLADDALVERARLLRRRVGFTGIARRRHLCADNMASEKKSAVAVHSLGCRAVGNKGEQEKSQKARRRRVPAAWI